MGEFHIMSKYLTQWFDYKLPAGQEFSVAVCGYSGKVRHLYLGKDPIRRRLVQHVYVDEDFCRMGDHCLSIDCPLNRSEPEHMLHMLDMNEDEILDPETAKEWGTESALKGFLLFARKISESLPEDQRKPQEPVND
jgi:hypothetical protein